MKFSRISSKFLIFPPVKSSSSHFEVSTGCLYLSIVVDRLSRPAFAPTVVLRRDATANELPIELFLAGADPLVLAFLRSSLRAEISFVKFIS